MTQIWEVGFAPKGLPRTKTSLRPSGDQRGCQPARRGMHVAGAQVEDRDGVVRVPGDGRVLHERESVPVRRPVGLLEPAPRKNPDLRSGCTDRADEDGGAAFSSGPGGSEGD